MDGAWDIKELEIVTDSGEVLDAEVRELKRESDYSFMRYPIISYPIIHRE